MPSGLRVRFPPLLPTISIKGKVMERKWTTLSGRPVENVFDEIQKLNLENERQIHIGTDAQLRGSKMVFASAVAVLNPGKGGMAFHSKMAFPRDEFKTLPQKLFREVQYSVEIAQEIADLLDQRFHKNIIVHVDANPNIKWNSSDYHKALVGWVVGAGFQALSKPESWCASHVADHAANGRNIRNTRERRREFRVAKVRK
jgi:predicted RNase H-related nuclease YkuK (DUF458 family)